MGAELERPFGIDANDFALLQMGTGLINDLDCIVSTVEEKRMQKRTLYQRSPGYGAQASAILGWTQKRRAHRPPPPLRPKDTLHAHTQHPMQSQELHDSP